MTRLNDVQRKWLMARFKDRVCFNEPMAPFTSFRIGGPAEALVAPATSEDLVSLVRGARDLEMAYRIIGGGTNLLVTDAGISGLVIRTTQCLEHISIRDEALGHLHVRVGAGVPIKRFCRYCLSQGLKGMNFAVGIPGTMGGGLVMNAGTGRGSMADVLSSIVLLTGSGDIRTLPRESICAEHRELSWHPIAGEASAGYPSVIMGGEFRLARGEVESLRVEAKVLMRDRVKKQPVGFPSAGCVFKNPPAGPPAGRLIDMAGLKGRRQGGAVVSVRHANYIVNAGGATAADVLAMMGLIQDTVWDRFKIRLEPEVKIVGD